MDMHEISKILYDKQMLVSYFKIFDETQAEELANVCEDLICKLVLLADKHSFDYNSFIHLTARKFYMLMCDYDFTNYIIFDNYYRAIKNCDNATEMSNLIQKVRIKALMESSRNRYENSTDRITKILMSEKE